MQEDSYLYLVSIELQCGVVKIHQTAHSNWEAIDRVYSFRDSNALLVDVPRYKYSAVRFYNKTVTIK